MNGVASDVGDCTSETIAQTLAEIVDCCDSFTASGRSPIGKRLLGAFYIHVSALPALDAKLQAYEKTGRCHLQKAIAVFENRINPTLIKFSTEQRKISYLFYPDFEIDPHPALHYSSNSHYENDSRKSV